MSLIACTLAPYLPSHTSLSLANGYMCMYLPPHVSLTTIFIFIFHLICLWRLYVRLSSIPFVSNGYIYLPHRLWPRAIVPICCQGVMLLPKPGVWRGARYELNDWKLTIYVAFDFTKSRHLCVIYLSKGSRYKRNSNNSKPPPPKKKKSAKQRKPGSLPELRRGMSACVCKGTALID